MRRSRLSWTVVALPLASAWLGCSSSEPAKPEPVKTSTTSSAAPATSAPAMTSATSTAAPGLDSPVPKGTATPGQMAAAARGDTEFALSLYGKVKGDGNTLLSPASARIALAMAHAGARGQTAEQMAKVLVFPNDAKTHEAFGAILGQWQSWAGAKVNSSAEDPTQPFTLRVANRLFGQKGRPFAPAFLTLLSDKYGAPLEQMDFKSAAEPSRKHINDWVEEKTEKRIKDLLPAGAVTPETSLVLVNALYFKADWAEKFEKEQTRDEEFLTTPQAKSKVPTMIKHLHPKYAETPDVQVLEMDYRGAPVAMTVILPRAKDGLAKLEGELSPAVLDGWIGKLSSVEVNVHLPKFKIESSLDLGKVLSGLGMSDAFDPKKADFSGMDGTKELFVSGVVQKTFCAVDEKGTEAAAATAVAMAGAAMPAAPPKDFIADHPFLFLIRDTATGSLLFVGRVAKPG